MELFQEFGARGHEQVTFCHKPEFGLKAIIAIHDTTLGPALGGCRMWQYDSEQEAIIDVLRLSRGMTYKAAVTGLELGGGKSVIIGDPQKDKSKEMWRAFGRFVEGLGGRYITAEDVGTSVHDMEIVRAETRHVTGISRMLGGSGDPSPVTARGVYVGIKAAAKFHQGRESLQGLKVAIQGLGHVGMHLADLLHHDGAELVVCDIHQEHVEEAVRRFSARPVGVDEIYSQNVDVFSPCALGAVVNDQTIDVLKCAIVAGAANNQLAIEKVHGPMLAERGILYAPDYVINAGGLINVFHEMKGYDEEAALDQADGIYDSLLSIFHVSKERDIPPHEASNHVAEERMQKARERRRDRLQNIYLHGAN
ncbi:MAG TPA: Glu/Leu/Phe/Val dehydrogenase dimerization domain-containing protein [Acidobacteriota bacterium]|nr:Glu/Leu/Phe/Val dehydrogenase dimerization domain-containing protein [Acidobacteriota bacterium]